MKNTCIQSTRIRFFKMDLTYSPSPITHCKIMIKRFYFNPYYLKIV